MVKRFDPSSSPGSRFESPLLGAKQVACHQIIEKYYFGVQK